MGSRWLCCVVAGVLVCTVTGFSFSYNGRAGKRHMMSNYLQYPVSLIRKFHNIPKIPKIRNARDKNKMSSMRIGASGYNPCKVTQLCQNGGTCIADQGAHFCKCPSGLYGKACEFVANTAQCRDNKCLNDATCYSVDEEVMIFYAPAGITVSPGDVVKGEGITEKVRYECWCKPGFTGSLCEYSPENRMCDHEYCLHKGVGKPTTVNGMTNCTCECDTNYVGDRCEIMLPCLHFKCENGGVCENEDISNSTQEMYRARCICPKDVEHGVAVSFIGDRCEYIDLKAVAREEDYCFPCKLNVHEYMDVCIDPVTQKEELELLKKMADDCGEECRYAKAFCLNDGVCKPEGRFFKSSSQWGLIPFCECRGMDEGILCHEKKTSPCNPTSFDSREADQKCGEHGSCVAKSDFEYICECNPGWTGDKCNVEDACYNNECSEESTCVALPVEKREQYSLSYTCLCNKNLEADFSGDSKVVKCKKLDFEACEGHKCQNEGRCYPCSGEDTQTVLQLCAVDEIRRGYRCVCPFGKLLPFCETTATSCSENDCVNGADCLVDPDNEFDFICQCKLGFVGRFCELEASPCSYAGLKSCVMGMCEEDDESARGFKCKCIDGYMGLNCDRPLRWDLIGFLQDNYAWTYPLMMLVLLAPFVLYATNVSERSAQREYELKKVEQHRLEEVKVRRREKRDRKERRARRKAMPEKESVEVEMPDGKEEEEDKEEKDEKEGNQEENKPNESQSHKESAV